MPNRLVVSHLNRNETDFTYKEIFEENAYFRHGVTLRDGDCVFDVGANIGLFSLYVGSKCLDAAIYAFEPLPPIFEILNLNAENYKAKGP